MYVFITIEFCVRISLEHLQCESEHQPAPIGSLMLCKHTLIADNKL